MGAGMHHGALCCAFLRKLGPTWLSVTVVFITVDNHSRFCDALVNAIGKGGHVFCAHPLLIQGLESAGFYHKKLYLKPTLTERGSPGV